MIFDFQIFQLKSIIKKCVLKSKPLFVWHLVHWCYLSGVIYLHQVGRKEADFGDVLGRLFRDG